MKIIQEKTNKFHWKHIPSGDHPADLVGRGIGIDDFLKNQLWLYGPSWMSQVEKHWPETKVIVSPQEKNEILKECKVVQPEEKILSIYVDKNKNFLLDKFQNFEKIININGIHFQIRSQRKEKQKKRQYERKNRWTISEIIGTK